ncbi:hypothetical protein IT399_03495 [Candidatus Nomurabacteria bacterium]|nr:hypothetical protein [Candidatus Nomurabacteria bacterium]
MSPDGLGAIFTEAMSKVSGLVEGKTIEMVGEVHYLYFGKDGLLEGNGTITVRSGEEFLEINWVLKPNNEIKVLASEPDLNDTKPAPKKVSRASPDETQPVSKARHSPMGG